MVPICAAKAAPERPATMIAVMSGPISRDTETLTRSATKRFAPNFRSWIAAWNARTAPISPTSPQWGEHPRRSSSLDKRSHLIRRGRRISFTNPRTTPPIKVMKSLRLRLNVSAPAPTCSTRFGSGRGLRTPRPRSRHLHHVHDQRDFIGDARDRMCRPRPGLPSGSPSKPQLPHCRNTRRGPNYHEPSTPASTTARSSFRNTSALSMSIRPKSTRRVRPS